MNPLHPCHLVITRTFAPLPLRQICISLRATVVEHRRNVHNVGRVVLLVVAANDGRRRRRRRRHAPVRTERVHTVRVGAQRTVGALIDVRAGLPVAVQQPTAGTHAKRAACACVLEWGWKGGGGFYFASRLVVF